MEIWKDVIGYEEVYAVSNKGRVKSLKRYVVQITGKRVVNEKILKSNDNGTGYLYVQLSNNNKREGKLVHRLVCQSFNLNENSYEIVNHKNGIKTDNRSENLEWCSQLQNIHHSIINGLTDIKGEKNYNSRLNELQILEIRNLYNKGVFGYVKIAKIYGVSWECIRNIIKRKTWKHI